MFFMNPIIVKLIIGAVIVVMVTSGIAYFFKLKSDLATTQANNVKLELSVDEQKKVIRGQKRDSEKIRKAMDQQTELIESLHASIKDLREKFNKINASGAKRDIGALAEQKPGLMQRAINNGSANATRCMEIAMGAPLTEKELSAIKKSEINPECPSIANPKYVPY